MAISNRIRSIFKDGGEKNVTTFQFDNERTISESSSGNRDGEPLADQIIEPGGLSFEEDVSGGMGRHLGLFSTTFLM